MLKGKYDPISSELISLHWLPVPIKQRIEFKIITLTYKSIHNQTPHYLSSLVSFQNTHRNIRHLSISSLRLLKPRTRRHTFADRSFSCRAPSLLNTLSQSIKNATSLDIFKHLLKTHLFRQATST